MYQQRTPSTASRSVIYKLLSRGFDNLVRGFGAGIDISLSTPVRNVHWHADAMRLHTPNGVVALARRLSPRKQWYWLVGGIRFTPELPDWEQGAFATLPMGTMNKFAIQ